MNLKNSTIASAPLLTAGGCAIALSLLSACNQHPLDVVELQREEHKGLSFAFAPKNKVDVLLVIDNSGSMGEEQANLAANFGAFVTQLEDAGADYRLAVTTTDMGNQWCAGSTPERGAFQASSCRERLAHFTSQSGVDVAASACTDICDLDSLGLMPTTVTGQSQAVVRPWLQAGGADVNLPEGVDAAEAFRCMGPQGVDGCGFESPLESLRMALLRTLSPDEAEFGFHREDAALAIIIVTDEVDCSVAPGGEDIFSQTGSRAFWADANDTFPTSAVCWNAGVKCEGDASGYTCESADKREDGSESADGSDAVLRPVDEYIELVSMFAPSALEAGGQQVHVALLGGVPSDLGAAGIPYADSPDPQFQHDFGIGAGCTGNVNGAVQTALPPVRLRDFAHAFAPDQIFSVCEPDYTETLVAVVDKLTPGLRGACIDACLEDSDAITPGVQPECVVREASDDAETRDVAACEIVDDEVVVPPGEPNCVLLRGDADGTATPGVAWDDAGSFCDGSNEGNVAIEVYLAQGVNFAPGSRFEGSCSVAGAADAQCG